MEGEGTGQNIQRMEKIEKERMNNSDDIRRRETVCVCVNENVSFCRIDDVIVTNRQQPMTYEDSVDDVSRSSDRADGIQ